MKSYNVKVYDYLLNAPEFIKQISKLTETPKRFIQAVKNFIDAEWDIKNGFVIDFNSDYSKIRKFKI